MRVPSRYSHEITNIFSFPNSLAMFVPVLLAACWYYPSTFVCLLLDLYTAHCTVHTAKCTLHCEMPDARILNFATKAATVWTEETGENPSTMRNLHPPTFSGCNILSASIFTFVLVKLYLVDCNGWSCFKSFLSWLYFLFLDLYCCGIKYLALSLTNFLSQSVIDRVAFWAYNWQQQYFQRKISHDLNHLLKYDAFPCKVQEGLISFLGFKAANYATHPNQWIFNV